MYSPYALHVDLRDDTPRISEIKEHLPKVKYDMRTKLYQDQYRWDCMNGQSHPLEIERDEYTLTTVHTVTIDTMVHAEQNEWQRQYTFNRAEMRFIQNTMKDPKVAWAIDNSFDGLYIHRGEDHAQWKSVYKFAVYLKTEQATFWKLKFHGR